MEKVFNIESLSEKQKGLLRGAVLCIGNFDGVHLGHQELIRQAKAVASAHRVPCVVFSFRPHPRVFFSKSVSLLTTEEEKSFLLSRLGVDYFLVQKFDKAFSQLNAQEFYQKYLYEPFEPKAIFVGFNFRYGSERSGGLEDLKNLATRDQTEVVVLPAQEYQPEQLSLSSSVIRKKLQDGELNTANQMLGRPFSYCGLVHKDAGRGRKIGFPTANIVPSDEKILLPLGVYITHLRPASDKRVFRSITNIGVRPTFQEREKHKSLSLGESEDTALEKVVIETHILSEMKNDFDSQKPKKIEKIESPDIDLYGKEIVVEFLKFIRPEKKFNSVDELKMQIRKDIERATDFF